MKKLGHYEILGELGRGGCGVVYRALDPALGRTVAIKTILSDGSGDSSRERFRREARSAGGLSHPNIVTIHEFNDSGDVMFIAMEYIDGQTLAERMSQPKLPIPFVLSTVRAAADALDFAHASNIVHRDVKPANFLITKQGLLKITDFGIAKVLDSDVSLTNTGMVVGTVQYMSPEQIAAQEITGRSDQFSLAVIAYEMLTGQRPFQGNSWASVIHSIMANEPPPLNQHREDLDSDATVVLRKALAKDPAARYETCREFADALERSILGATVEQRVFWEKASVTQLLPSDSDVTALMTRATAPVTTTKEKTALPVPATARPVAPSGSQQVAEPTGQPVAARRPWVMPVVAGAVVAIGLGGWMLALYLRHSQDAAAHLAAGSPSNAQPLAAASPQPQTLQNGSPDSPAQKNSSDSARGAKVERSSPNTPSPVRQDRTSAPAVAAAAPAGGPAVSEPPPQQPTEAANPVTPPTPPVATPLQSAPAAKPVETPPAPVATPSPAPAAPATSNTAAPAARGPDPAQAAAQRHAAELQAANRAVADTIARYRQAFEARDLEGLKTVWPTLGRNEQSSFQNFFRIVRSVKLEMTPVSEPEITASGAVAQYRRVISASDERRDLPTQTQTVKVTFRRSGDRMFIDTIEAVSR